MGTRDWTPGKPQTDSLLTPDANEQVAAVCYRARGASLEFLLVRTRKGRWTFPKGRCEPGLSHAESAALEAFEEAGVQGRIEEDPFASYRRGKLSEGQAARGAKVVHAYLCQVLRLVPPPEPDRNRTWFSAARAKEHLRQGRAPENASDLTRVVDAAAARIQRLRGRAEPPPDALQKVRFEKPESEFTGWME